MSTHWLRPHINGDPDDGMLVHTPEEAIIARRDGWFWRAEAHTETGAAALARKRWVQADPADEPGGSQVGEQPAPTEAASTPTKKSRSR